MQEIYDVIIIGGGPAGISASIYSLRAGLKTLLIESQILGGKLYKISNIENYPGFKNISGNDLASNFVEQVNNFNINSITATVTNIKTENDYKAVILNNNTSYLTKTVLVTTGDKEKLLELPMAKEFTGRGISYCAVCDGFFFRNKDVVVIGGGNSALQEALYLANITNKVTIIIRREEFRADKSLVNKVINNKKIEIIKNHLPYELIVEDDKLMGLKIQDVNNQNISSINAQGIFPYIGSSAATSFLDSTILDKNGYVIVKQDMSTNISGIYAAGDCINSNLKQIITACGQGASAINSIIDYLK